MLSFSERNYAAGNNVGLADDSEFASLIQMPVFYIKFIPCLSSTLQVLISPPANFPESRYSPNLN